MERRTRQRDAIRATFAEAARPLAVQEAHLLALKTVPGLGIATVYRNIKALLDEGFLAVVELPGEPARYEASGLIDEAGVYYELDPASGWVQLRKARLPGLITRKQRAAISRDQLLASIPGAPGQGPKFLLTDRREPLPKVLDGPPDAIADPATRRLWDAATARFGAEWQGVAEPP
mgnify:CR=1 FL=1